ncbi:hypothetical protein Cni_G07203 [Canna indica]|uniref:GTD-binding domain-containing protein n=1 Tax=Canna indica TaxID=4628 RepID=A0AAQ3JYC6_9LILI|nr:hypothetical protein Cni_G07203 [Canna indica]
MFLANATSDGHGLHAATNNSHESLLPVEVLFHGHKAIRFLLRNRFLTHDRDTGRSHLSGRRGRRCVVAGDAACCDSGWFGIEATGFAGGILNDQIIIILENDKLTTMNSVKVQSLASSFKRDQHHIIARHLHLAPQFEHPKLGKGFGTSLNPAPSTLRPLLFPFEPSVLDPTRALAFTLLAPYMTGERPAPIGVGIAGGGAEVGRAISVLMDPRASVYGTCACSCACCGTASLRSDAWLRSLKRKMDAAEAAAPSAVNGGFARVDIEEEVAALREAVISQQQAIQALRAELEEERSAAASAATEAMSMILRLQREKAEAHMEVRQFKRFAEEKMAHDQEELAALEDMVFKRDEAILALSCEVQACHHHLLSLGISISDALPTEPKTPDTATVSHSQFDFSCYDYPSLRCTIPADDAPIDLEKYPFGETPSEQLQKLEERICQLERTPSSGHFSNAMEKRVVVGHSPPRSTHIRRLSIDSCGSSLEFSKGEEFPVSVDYSDYGGRDDTSDRVCTIDTMHGASKEYAAMQREDHNKKYVNSNDDEIDTRRLYMRLEALEADRETMRQTLISMGTDKTQVVMLKEIAQHLYKDVTSEKRIIKKHSFLKRFSIVLVVKCVLSFVFHRKKPSRIRYNFGRSASNVGLLLLLHNSARVRHQRFLKRIEEQLPTFSSRQEMLSRALQL